MITGDKFFKMSNHLGNVLQVVTDNKLPDPDGQNGVDHYVADVVSYSDYYPFGMQMPGRSANISDYRYGLMGMEKDDEIKGEGNSLDFGARIYDPRIDRWLSTDPLARKQPGWSPYKVMLDNPIIYSDPDGETEYLEVIINDKTTGKTTSIKVAVSDDLEGFPSCAAVALLRFTFLSTSAGFAKYEKRQQ